MSTAREILADELAFNQYGEDGSDCLIDWDQAQIPAVVSDVEYRPGEDEADIERKMVSVQKADIQVRPEPGDEILLNLDSQKVDGGDYWRVEKVRDLDLEYDIYFFRYVS